MEVLPVKWKKAWLTEPSLKIDHFIHSLKNSVHLEDRLGMVYFLDTTSCLYIIYFQDTEFFIFKITFFFFSPQVSSSVIF